MPGLVPGIHVYAYTEGKTWMAGTSPAMTVSEDPSIPKAIAQFDRRFRMDGRPSPGFASARAHVLSARPCPPPSFP
ncbi:hypothetical protein ABIB78_003708 [Bradyrhizobium sp. I1.14.4]